jgi:hypothetical protein
MERFLNRHANRVMGRISGFDRMVFRATLPYLSHAAGMEKFLGSQKVLLKDFGHYLEGLSAGIKKHAEQIAEAEKRPVQYVASSAESKEKIAQQIAEGDGIRSGLICVLTCVEPCKAFEILKDRKQKLLRVVKRDRKCLHVYFYYLDREFGLMHIRLQTISRAADGAIKPISVANMAESDRSDRESLPEAKFFTATAWLLLDAPPSRICDRHPISRRHFLKTDLSGVDPACTGSFCQFRGAAVSGTENARPFGR